MRIQVLAILRKMRVSLPNWVQLLHFIAYIENIVLLVKFIDKFSVALSFKIWKMLILFIFFHVFLLFPTNQFFPSKHFPFSIFMTSSSFGISHHVKLFFAPLPLCSFLWSAFPLKKRWEGLWMVSWNPSRAQS